MIVIIEITFEKQVKVNERLRSPHIDRSAFSTRLSSVLKNMINSDFLKRCKTAWKLLDPVSLALNYLKGGRW